LANPVTHFETNARDAKAQQKFYGDLFGWKIDTNNPQDYGMATAQDGTRGINGGIGASQDGRSWVTFYIETVDLPATLARIERLGGRTVMPPMGAGATIYALFADPEGNVVGLANMPQPPKKRAAGRKKTTARKPAKRKIAVATKRTAAKKKPTRKR